MKTTIAAVLALLFSVSAAGAERLGRNDRPTWNPPDRFDRPYEGRLVEHQLPQQAVRRYCEKLDKFFFDSKKDWGPHTRGCAFPRDGFCIVVYIDRPYGLSWPQAVRQHEIGHCNGWPNDHPN